MLVNNNNVLNDSTFNLNLGNRTNVKSYCDTDRYFTNNRNNTGNNGGGNASRFVSDQTIMYIYAHIQTNNQEHKTTIISINITYKNITVINQNITINTIATITHAYKYSQTQQ